MGVTRTSEVGGVMVGTFSVSCALKYLEMVDVQPKWEKHNSIVKKTCLKQFLFHLCDIQALEMEESIFSGFF